MTKPRSDFLDREMDSAIRSFLHEAEAKSIKAIFLGAALWRKSPWRICGRSGWTHETLCSRIHKAPIEFDDCDAEFALRGVDAPYEAAKAELQAISAASRRASTEMTEERRSALADVLVDHLSERRRQN